MDKKKILVVDYEPKALDRLVSLIPKDKFEVYTAKDGLQAIEEYDKFKPDLVLLRTMLPKKHGFQVCQEMVEKNKSVPVIMHCSIYKGRKYKADGMKIYGAADYLDDPIDQKTLNEILERFIPTKEEPKLVEFPKTEVPPPQETSTKKKGSLDIDKALEETLSGLKVPSTPKKKDLKIEETVPIQTPLEVVKEEIKKEEEVKVEKELESKKEEGVITSEEIFGDVIKKVEEKIIKKEEQQTPPKIDIEKVLGEEKKEGIEIAPPKVGPKAELVAELKVEVKAQPPLKVKKPISDVDKKLEETLSGVKIKPRIAKKSYEAPKAESKESQQLKVVEEKELPKVEEKVEEKVIEKAEEEVEVKREVEKVKEEGTPFGQYRLLEKVAIGGMAELFKAKQVGLEGFQRIVAVKRILPHLASNSDFVTMFIDEAKLAAQLNHPNIVHIYDLGKADDSYFIAMEFVEGRDLRSIMKEAENLGKTIPLPAAIFIAKKICSALHYAHTAKDADGKPMRLVHRDVSPQNIIISTSGEVKLVDFGIAKAASKASHTQSGALKGKLLYMSPEQAWGKTIDGRSDIFSLGVVLFEMLTGKKLFYGDSEMSILERVREAKLPDFGEFSDKIPPQLEKIIRKALEKDPDRRYRDGRSLEGELDKFAKSILIAPTGYDVVAFLNEIFPSVYGKEKLEPLLREKEEAEGEIAQLKKAQEEERIKEEAKKEEEEAVKVALKEEVKAKPPVKPQFQRKKPQPKPIRIPPPKIEKPEVLEKKELETVSEVPKEGKKTGLIIGGGIALAVVIIIVIALAFSGKKETPTTHTQTAQNLNPPKVEIPPSTPPQKQPETPPEIKPEAPPPSPQKVESPEDIRKARDSALNAIKSLEEVLNNIEKNQGNEFAPNAVDSLKKSKANIDRLFRNAKSVGEFEAVLKSSKQLTDSANKTLGDIESLKAQKEKEIAEAEARKKAEEEKRKKEEEAKKEAQQQPQEKKIAKGDFVPIYELVEGEKPKLITKVEANYSTLARQNKVQGTFYLELTIDENGKVTDAKVIKGPSPDYGLNNECVKAALQWRFTPAIKGGVPVKTKMTYPIIFKLK